MSKNPGDTPSRLLSMRALKEKMDAALEAAITVGEAEAKRYKPVSQVMSTRLWDNVIFAMSEAKKSNSVIVKLAENRIQVWQKMATA